MKLCPTNGQTRGPIKQLFALDFLSWTQCLILTNRYLQQIYPVEKFAKRLKERKLISPVKFLLLSL